MSHLEGVAKQAESDFADYVIERKQFGLWRCTKPNGSSMGSFWVSAAGPALIVFGDLGELIFLPYAKSALRWALGCKFDVLNPYYPMTKVSPQMKKLEFFVPDATAYLKERIEEDLGDRERWLECLREWEERRPVHYDPSESEREWWELWASWGDPEAPDCRVLTHRTCWVWAAVCWFMGKVSFESPLFAEELAPEASAKKAPPAAREGQLEGVGESAGEQPVAVVQVMADRGPWVDYETELVDPAEIAKVWACSLGGHAPKVRVQVRRSPEGGIAWFVLERQPRYRVRERGGSGSWDWPVKP